MQFYDVDGNQLDVLCDISLAHQHYYGDYFMKDSLENYDTLMCDASEETLLRNINGCGQILRSLINQRCNRYSQLSLDNLETTMMWAIKSITESS